MFIFSSLRRSKIPEYSSIAPNTNTMQAMTQLFIAVNPSALGLIFFMEKLIKYNHVDTLGELVCIVLWMLIRTRNNVTSMVMRPGITSGLIKKLKIN